MNSPNPSYITIPTQKVVWKVVATNNGTVNALPNVKVVLGWSTAPVYHRLSSVTDGTGVLFGDGSAAGTFFDTATNTWQVGTLAVGQSKTLYVETSLPALTDLGVALPLTLTKTISLAGLTDSYVGNNVSIDILNAVGTTIECAPVAGNIDGVACRCSLLPYTTLCNFGVTTFELIPGSFVNTTSVGLNLDAATGDYTKFLLDPTLPGSFDFRVVCTDGLDTFGPFGSATVTIPALFDSTDGIINVANYAALPLATASTGLYYYVVADQGSGSTYRQNGLYYSNGVNWIPSPTFIPQSFTELYIANPPVSPETAPVFTAASATVLYDSIVTNGVFTSGDENTGEITILKAGLYRIEFIMSGISDSAAGITFTVEKNGTTDIKYVQKTFTAVATDFRLAMMNFTDTFALNDIVVVNAKRNTAGTSTLSIDQMNFRITRVG